MADVTFTGVATPDVHAKLVQRVAGGTIAKHDVVYIDTSDDNKIKAADNSASANATAYGIATHAASSGEAVLVAPHGTTLTVGGGLTANTFYFVSSTAGAIHPEADLASTEFISRVGYASATTTFVVDIKNTGLQKA